MPLFHTHLFQESLTEPETLYCRCGATKSIHQHVWETKNTLKNTYTGISIGYVLICKKCGDYKKFDITD